MIDKFLGWAIYGVPAICSFLYAMCGVAHLFRKNYGYSLMWIAYAFANIGIILAMRAKE